MVTLFLDHFGESTQNGADLLAGRTKFRILIDEVVVTIFEDGLLELFASEATHHGQRVLLL